MVRKGQIGIVIAGFFIFQVLLLVGGWESGCEGYQRQRVGDPVRNGSFERLTGEGPTGWSRSVWGGEAEFGYETAVRTGERCVKIASTTGGDASWTIRASVRIMSRYRLTGWIKTEGLEAGSGRGALLNLHDLQPLATSALTGTNDWAQVALIAAGTLDINPQQQAISQYL